MQKTLSIIKPDATKRSLEIKILNILHEAKFKIIALKRMQFSSEQVAKFYAEHKEKAFFHQLCKIMSSNPIICLILKKENVIMDYRTIMGATDPAKASFGTIRNLYGISMDENTVHGSDSIDSAEREINLIFHPSEIFE